MALFSEKVIIGAHVIIYPFVGISELVVFPSLIASGNTETVRKTKSAAGSNRKWKGTRTHGDYKKQSCDMLPGTECPQSLGKQVGEVLV